MDKYKPGGGGGHSYYLLAMWLDYMGFAMEPTKEWKLGRGGTTSSLTALRLGISAPTSNFCVLYGTERNPNHSSVLSSATRLHEI